jgi:group I intron endonuclease
MNNNDYNNNYNNNTNIIPVVSYSNAYKYKSIIYQENKNKSGIYRWNNLVTGDSYVGSAINLTNRLSNYFSFIFLKRTMLKSKSIINNSLLKYGYNNFSLDILEYCESSVLIKREQYYLDTLKPKYNILKIAGSSLGYRHSPETLLKYKERRLSPEALINLKLAKKGKAPTSSLRKINHLLATGHITTVVNKKDNSVKVYNSIRAVSRDIGINPGTIANYINTNKWLRDTYLITGITNRKKW